MAELAGFLTARGHDVITISSKPGRATVEPTPDGLRILHRQLWLPMMGRFRLQPFHTFLPGALASLARHKVDVVHCMTYVDAFAACLLRRLGARFRLVFQVTGPAVPYWFPRIPPDRFMLRGAVAGADALVAHSEFTAAVIREHYGREPHVIPVPIELDAFPLRERPAEGPPILLHVGSFAERRKGLRVMLRAFERVLNSVPDAVLRLSGHMPDPVRQEEIEPLPRRVRQRIEVLGVGDLYDVPRLYREASLTVLPSMWEGYGMVVVESWASGTPVVVTHHGGLPELVNDPALGCTFDPGTEDQETLNCEGLAEAILKTLPLASQPETRLHGRARAEEFTWSVLGPAYERLCSAKAIR